jgi:hypothetical protein
MRSHKLVIVTGLLVLGCLGLMFVGCSSDEAPISGVEGIDGQYPVVQEEINGMVSSSLDLFTDALEIVIKSWSIDSLTRETDDGIITSSFGFDTVSTADMWYILSRTELGAAGTHVVVDSLMFIKNGSPQLTAVGADGLILRHRWTLTHSQEMQSYDDYIVSGEFRLTGLNTDRVYVTGQANMQVNSVTADSSLNRQLVMDATVTSLLMDRLANGWSPCCPSSGAMEATAQVTCSVGDAQGVASNWSVQATFIDGTMGAVVSDGTHQEEYVKTFCTVL